MVNHLCVMPDSQCHNILLLYRYRFHKFENVFTGTELVDWLLQRGLVSSREDGVNYGDILLRGQVIEHVLQEHYFYDDDYFYHIINE